MAASYIPLINYYKIHIPQSLFLSMFNFVINYLTISEENNLNKSIPL